MIDSREVEECAYLLSKARTAADVDSAWISTGEKNGVTAIVALEEYGKSIFPDALRRYSQGENPDLVHYFSGGGIYFINDELLRSYVFRGRADFKIDYSLMFDTNIASYINALVRGESLYGLHDKVISLVDDILHDDLNFDFLFYMVENVKNIKTEDLYLSSPIKFWRRLDKKFRRNLVSLQIFRSIDCSEYKRTCNPKPRFTYREAARRAIEFSFDFYASERGRKDILEFSLKQRAILLQVIGMVRIQLASKKSPRNKLSEFFDYVNDVVGAYFDREAIIAHKYFLDSRALGMLEKIKKSGKRKGLSKKGVLKKLDNIAWDLAAPRFMEKLMVLESSGEFFVPMFLSFDNGLKEVLRAYPVKGVIFDKAKGELIPLPKVNTEEYFSDNGCSAEIYRLYEKKQERLSKPSLNRLELHKLIRREYKVLRELI